jgi:hypothetical protein
MFNSIGALLIDILVSTIIASIMGTMIVLVWGKDKAV